MGTMKPMRLAAACALAVMTVAPVEAQVQESVLHNFKKGTGGSPLAGVTLAADGIYGTTELGGTANLGVVYKVDTAFHYTVLHNFTGADGATPLASVIRDSAGNLYGTTVSGGTGGSGVLYKLDSAGNYTVLYNFTGGADGGGPKAGVVGDSSGNLYGTAPNGGTAGYGVVYKLDSTGNYTVLYNFTGGADGGWPLAGVIRDSAGNLYGTAYYGGTARYGVVYKLDSAGNYTVLYTFAGGADGGQPYAGVIRTPAGNLIGTTQLGGSGNNGVVFALTGVQ